MGLQNRLDQELLLLVGQAEQFILIVTNCTCIVKLRHICYFKLFFYLANLS